MSEFAFQEALVRFLTEEKVRTAVYESDLQTQAELGISLEHAQRLLQIERERLEFFANIISHNRVHDFLRLFPCTAKLLGEQMVRIAEEFQRGVSTIYTDRYDHSFAF